MIGTAGKGEAVARRLLAAIALLWLVSCAAFVPRYDATVGTQTTEAYRLTSELLSQIELGKFEQAASFTAAIDDYAAIDALLATAELQASTLSVATRVSRTARDDLVGFIQGCRAQIRSLADQHRRFGFAQGIGATAGSSMSSSRYRFQKRAGAT